LEKATPKTLDQKWLAVTNDPSAWIVSKAQNLFAP
jgi:hypothetical protein